MFLLFEKCEDREFFLTICMEKGIGQKLVNFNLISIIIVLFYFKTKTQDDFDSMRNQPPLLFQKYINPLVKRLTDIDEFFQVLEMSLNALKLYIEPGEFIAERKALVYLIGKVIQVIVLKLIFPFPINLWFVYIIYQVISIKLRFYISYEVAQNS